MTAQDFHELLGISATTILFLIVAFFAFAAYLVVT